MVYMGGKSRFAKGITETMSRYVKKQQKVKRNIDTLENIDNTDSVGDNDNAFCRWKIKDCETNCRADFEHPILVGGGKTVIL